MIVEGLHHVSVNVGDTEVALGFYRDVLGLAVLPRPAFAFAGAWLDVGSGRQLHLIEAAAAPDMGQHLAFKVADIDVAVELLRAAGVDTPDPTTVIGTQIRQTFVHDPSGNRVEFTQPELG